MSPVRTVYVPRCSSQLGSSQRDKPQPDQTTDQTEPPQCQRDERGDKRGNVRGGKTVLKVRLQKLNKRTLFQKVADEDNTPRRWTLEAAANKPKTNVNPGGETKELTSVSTQVTHADTGAGTDSNAVGGDVFFFSQRPTSRAINGKEKAKLAVLRTISKMLEENQLIRQRLTSVSQAN